MPECGGNGDGGTPNFCTTIYDNFNPIMAYPTDFFTKIRPEWEKCELEWMGNWVSDPPIALTEMASPVTPVPAPGGGLTTPTQAIPGPTLPPQASPTKSGTNPTGRPNDPANNSPGGNDSPGGNIPPTGDNTSPGNTSPGSNNSPGDNSPADNNSPNDNSPAGSNSPGGNNSPAGNNSPNGQNNPEDPSPANRNTSPTGIAGAILQVLGQTDNKDSAPNPGANNAAQNENTNANSNPNAANQGDQALTTIDSIPINTAPAQPGAIVVDGTTFKPGEIATMNSHAILAAGTAVIVDGSTTLPLPQAQVTKVAKLEDGFEGAVYTINGQVYTATELPNGDFVVDGTMIKQGEVKTIDGVRVSDGKHGLVVGSKTMSVSKMGDSTKTASGSGGKVTSTTTSSAAVGLDVRFSSALRRCMVAFLALFVVA